jgi:16S rRNA A1518/A1519 N6-dimethyltransferase RsmA/KsgA/DIM1 with predicted DNA glycosylase/AP lyase activity
MPTGSGKTWVQGIISKYYCKLGKRVTIIEPNEDLMKQTSEKLGKVDFEISFITIKDFYKYGCDDDIIIIDEYDWIVQDLPYYVHNSLINGLWSFKEKKVIAFSATTLDSIERLITKCIASPAIVKFVSEYELLKGVSPI